MWGEKYQQKEFPAVLSGYELNPVKGYFSVIIPEETTNLVPTNPSFEDGASTNYAAEGGGSIAVVNTWQAFGAFGLEVTPVSLTESGVYLGSVTGISLTSGSTYTASVVIQGTPGKIYYIWFASAAGALLGSKKKYIASGFRERIWVTYTETASNSRRIYVTRDSSHSGVAPFYVDGFQVEEKAYPTTYCDGDQVGFVIDEVSYFWNGADRLSTSTRLAGTRSGGKEMKLLDLGISILSIVGLGVASLVDLALPIPGVGQFPIGTGTVARDFALVGAITSTSQGDFSNLHRKRQALFDAIRPDYTASPQPIVLRYQALDECGDPISEPLDIRCKYISGLEGSWASFNQERIALNFRMHLPFISSTYSNGADLGSYTSVTDFGNIGVRDVDGTWSDVGGGLSSTVWAMAFGPDGSLYVGGQFLNAGGVANADYIAKWDGSAWTALGTGMDGNVYAIVVDPSGNVYAGGAFNSAGGVANTPGIAKWDGSSWSALATGVTVAGDVNTLLLDNAGILYMGGTFASVSGVANTGLIAKWNGAAWSAMGTGGTSGGGASVNALALDQAGNVYVAGNFGALSGVSFTQLIAKWNGVTWSALGSPNLYRFTSPSVSSIFNMAFGQDGTLYVGGNLMANDFYGLATGRMFAWNGTSWTAIGNPNNTVNTIDASKLTNTIYVGGNFTEIGGVSLPEGIAVYNGTTWGPLDITTQDPTPTILDVVEDKIGRLYIGGGWTGTTALSATISVTNASGVRAYPKIVFTGPGVLWQLKNYTTGATISFRNLTLQANEVATLNLDPEDFYFTSSYRGNLLPYIMSGSILDWFLLGGDNNIGAFMLSTTAASSIIMSWQNLYWSVDGVIE